MLTALITGASGFCGRHLARQLRQREDLRLVGASRSAEIGGERAPDCRDDRISVDITDPIQVTEVIHRVQPDYVYHLAGLTRGCAADIYRVNLMGTLNLLEAVRTKAPSARVLLVGSAAEYGPQPDGQMPITEACVCHPASEYGASKYAATLAGQEYARRGMRVVIARPFNVIGAGMPSTLVVGAVLERVRDALRAPGEAVVSVGNIDTSRDFIAVRDVVAAYQRLMDGNHWGEVFNLCSGSPVTIRSLLTQLLAFAPRPVCLRHDPGLARGGDISTFYGSAIKAEKAIGFCPRVGLSESLEAAWIHAMGGVSQ